MKTIIKIKTFKCVCGYHQDFKSVVLLCPSCQQHNLIKEIDPDKKATITIMGEGDIDSEIVEIKESKIKTIDISTVDKKNVYIKSRKQDIKEAIKEMKLLED